MTLQSWADRSRMQIEAYGFVKGGLAAARSLWSGGAHRLSAVRSVNGEYIYERDWDLLVVLDACRVDALSTVADEYDFLPTSIPSIKSPAPNSALWLERNFRPEFEEAIGSTGYVSGNSHTEGFSQGEFPVGADAFCFLERVYDYDFDTSVGTVPPMRMTDAAVRSIRQKDASRTVVHYMQPHTPYRLLDTDAIGGVDGKRFRETVWDLIASGQLNREDAWEMYLDTLRWGLDAVDLLLRSVDAEHVVITADHGECFGEWGAFGHSPYGTFDALRRVPWVECTASNTSGYDPEKREANEDISLEKQLEYLGYR